MSKVGNETRQRILSVARELSLKQGYISTPIDEVIEKSGITKGSFFHHFPNKQALCIALIEEFSTLESRLMNGSLEKAKKLSKDPLQQLLIFIGLIQERYEEPKEDYIGCLFASYSYQNQLEHKEVKDLITGTLNQWKNQLDELIQAVLKKYPPTNEIKTEELAEMFLVTIEGAYVMSRIMDDTSIMRAHLQQYKNYLETLFQNSTH